MNRHLKTAIEVIRDSELDKRLASYHCAIIVKGGKVISVGMNKIKNSELMAAFAQDDFIKTVHAEAAAILKVRKKIDLTGCKLYVARIAKCGAVGNSMPCATCAAIMKSYGIKRVYYTLCEETYASERVK